MDLSFEIMLREDAVVDGVHCASLSVVSVRAAAGQRFSRQSGAALSQEVPTIK
jgi:hypothetical protein